MKVFMVQMTGGTLAATWREGASPWRHPAIALLAASILTVFLAATSVMSHSVQGRTTLWTSAVSWAAATSVTWLLVTVVSLNGFARLGRGASAGWRTVAGCVALAGVVLVLAPVLRAALDLLLPQTAQLGGPFADRAIRFALRWLDSGILAYALLLIAGFWWSRHAATAHGVERASEGVPAIVIRHGERSITVRHEQIDYVRGAGNYVEIHADSARHLARRSMSRMQEDLGNTHFVRVHRSAIVARSAIREVIRRDGAVSVVVRDGTEIPVSRMGRRALEAMLGPRA